ncbi:MAG: hypothetical protein GY718_18235 [Lentisphaerae bacterium]|nr:hypothetical protein [Lentisphaerota bacterium]
MKFEWECINDSTMGNVGNYTSRAKIPNGWLVKNEVYIFAKGVTSSMIFIEDRNHNWKVDK